MSPPFKHWQIAVAALLGMMVSSAPVLIYPFAVFLEPVSRQFGWGRAVMPGALVLAAPVMSALYPVVGWLLDRVGSRVLLLWSFVLFGLSVASLSLLNGSTRQLVTLFVIAAIFSTGPTSIAYARLISKSFSSNRGLILGIGLGVGGGVGAVVLPVLTQYLIGTFGWRGAYVGIGLAPILVGWSTAFLLLKRETRIVQGPAVAPDRARGLSIGEVLKTHEFWLLLSSVLLSCTAINGVMAHIAAIGTDRGLTASMAAFTVSLIAVFQVAGQFLMGVFLDRSKTPRIALPMFGCLLLGIIVLHMGHGTPAMFLAPCLIGFGAGSEYGLLPYFVTRFFGLRSFGRVYGSIFGASAIAIGIGPYLMGRIFDATGTYNIAFAAFEVAVAITLVCVASLRRYAFPAKSDA